MTKDEVVKILLGNGTRPETAALYADAYILYHEATENIDKNGAIVAHPRTGLPITNPYVPVQKEARRALQDMRGARTDGLW